MSEYIPAEREYLYHELGLEELLEDKLPTEGPLVINDKKDHRGNDIQAVWDRDSNTVHMVVLESADLDIEVPTDSVNRAFEEHMHTFASKLGWSALEGVLIEGRRAA